MTGTTAPTSAPDGAPEVIRAGHAPRRHTGRILAVVLTVLAVILVITGTKVVPDGQEPAAAKEFDKTTYGAETFPDIQKGIEEKAVPAPELARALQDDPDATAEENAVVVEGKPVFSTTFTGTVKEGDGGIYEVDVPDMPEDITVRLQTGPAINGTELRDATGTLEFGQFKNQIEYQDAGAALNEEMKKQVLDPVDIDSLEGKEITVTGAFTAINPEGWHVTPSSLEVA
jgi:predicted lipoprotein